MINPQNVMDILGNLISERLAIPSTSSNGLKDEEVATILFKNIQSILNCSSYSFEDEDSLDLDFNIELTDDDSPFDNNEDDDENIVDDDSYDVEDDYDDDRIDEDEYDDDRIDEDDYDDDKIDDDCIRNYDSRAHPDYNDKRNNENEARHQFSLEYMKNVVQFYDEKDPKTGKRKHSFAGVQRRFKKVKDKGYISRFRKYIETQGTKRQKLNQIDSFVYKSFHNSRQQLLSVHDVDLKRWGLKKAAELGDTSFLAGDRWLYEFKKRHHVVSRKISKLVTKRDVLNKDDINQSAEDFVHNAKKVILNYHPDYVLNTDQSGLQLEMFSNRTLSHEGEKLTPATVRSINNTTHSYTVQPIITMSGKLIRPLFLCLKENSGRLSESIKKTLFQANNIVLTCSKSGKLTGSLVKYWRDNVLKPLVGQKKSLLLSDCWGAQGAIEIYNKLANVKRLEIPKRTTSMIQPLDVYFNRQYKVIARKLYDYVRLHNMDINLAERNNIIKMNSLIHNQLSSKAFYRMIQYAWFQSGYLRNDPGAFKNVKEICFSFQSNSCSTDHCDEFTFICCSWCEKSLCINHFFVDYHIHY